jgi:putative oxidoreductase
VNVGQLALRGTIGPLFVGHGAQKLFGWFDGHGLEGTAGFFEGQLGLRPGKRHATAAGLSEFAGGAMLTAGALTPLATSLLTGTMVTAIRKAHARNGVWVTGGGYEYNLVLIAAFAALTDAGPGKPSVDAARFPRLKGKLLALASVAAGVAGSYLVTEVFSDSEPAPQEGASELAADPASAADQDTARTDEGRFAPQTQTSDVTSPAS